MSSRAYKISLLGDWKSGRSSLLEALGGPPRPAHRGVTLTPWRDPHSGREAALWDVDSRSLLESFGQTFLAGADGLLAVCDLARGQNADYGRAMLADAWRLIGDKPSLILLNKSDLAGAPAAPAAHDGVPVVAVSARQPESLRQALSSLLQRLGD